MTSYFLYFLAVLFIIKCSSEGTERLSDDKDKNNSRCIKSGWYNYSVKRKEKERLSAAAVFTINSWFGRMGNNFMQIKHAVRYAVCCRAKLVIKPKNSYMPNLQYFMDFSKRIAYSQKLQYVIPRHCATSWEDPFFVALKAFPLPSCNYDEYAALQYIIFGNEYPSGCPSSNLQCSPKLDDALVVHIRSGDIFGSINFNSAGMNMYRQPPVAYYEEIFSSRPWSRIQFITSLEKMDAYNPVWRYYLDPKNLKKKINLSVTSVQFQTSNDVLDDLKTLLCARYFVASSSTFSNMIIYMAPHLKEFFAVENSVVRNCSVFYQRIDQHGVVCNQRALPGYIMATNWSNSRKQREYMIKYRFPVPTPSTSKDSAPGYP